MSPHGLADGLAGHLQLVDVEDADTAEITVSRALLSRDKDNLAACCQTLRQCRARRGTDHLFTATTAPFDQLIPDFLRERGLLR